MPGTIRIEVVFATPERQELLVLECEAGITLQEAILRSGICGRFPGEIDLQHMPVGVFGKIEKNPAARVLADGDRVEIYRPLAADPKEARRARARRAKQKRLTGRG